METSTVTLNDPAATRQLGRRLAAQWLQTRPAGATVLLLHGDLGAGKTSLVQGIAETLGVTEPITSPTFALAQHYRGSHSCLVHLDLYRLEQHSAADDLFLQELEAAHDQNALLALEWPERLSFVPEGCWQVQLTLLDPHDPDRGRLARLQGTQAPP